MATIAVVEDDSYLREELIQMFCAKGHLATGIAAFHAAEQELLGLSPDLVVLDVNLPGKSGYQLCRELRARASFPILILTARDTLSDELTALGLGADVFLTKPCHPDRLIARVERLLHNWSRVKHVIQVGGLSLDWDSYKLVWQNAVAILPETEGKLLQLLMERYPATVQKEELFARLWGTQEFVDENILQVNVARLRKSLAALGLEGLVKTVRVQGYCLEGEG